MEKPICYKAATREQLALAAGVCRQTLDKWIKENKKQLIRLGYKPRSVLPPSVVSWLCEKYVIAIEN